MPGKRLRSDVALTLSKPDIARREQRIDVELFTRKWPLESGVRIWQKRNIRLGVKNDTNLAVESQSLKMNLILIAYLRCLKSNTSTYQENKVCIVQKKSQWRKLLAKEITNLRFKYIFM